MASIKSRWESLQTTQGAQDEEGSRTSAWRHAMRGARPTHWERHLVAGFCADWMVKLKARRLTYLEKL